MSKENQKRLYNAASPTGKRLFDNFLLEKATAENWDGKGDSGITRSSVHVDRIDAQLYNAMVKISLRNGDEEPPTLPTEREFYVRTKLTEEEQQALDKLKGPESVRFASKRPMLRDRESGKRDQIVRMASERLKKTGDTGSCSRAELEVFDQTRMRDRTNCWAPIKTGLTGDRELELIQLSSPNEKARYQQLDQIIDDAWTKGDLEDWRFTSMSRAIELRQADNDAKRAGSKLGRLTTAFRGSAH